MEHIRIEDDGTVTERWSGHEIRNARRGFWFRGVPLYEVRLRIRPAVRELANPFRYVGGRRNADWLEKYNARQVDGPGDGA